MQIQLSAKLWPGVKSKIADKTLSCSALVSEENSLRRVALESRQFHRLWSMHEAASHTKLGVICNLGCYIFRAAANLV